MAYSQKNILKRKQKFFMLVFVVVSGENCITDQTSLVLCTYHFVESLRFENLRKAPESSTPAWLLTAHSIQSKIKKILCKKGAMIELPKNQHLLHPNTMAPL